VIDYIVARALKKKADERYASAGEFARDLRDALKEVHAAEAAGLERAEAKTVPNVAEGRAETSPASLVRDEPMELRPSPRFDSTECLARLSVLPSEADATSSRAGWTVRAKAGTPKMDRARALIVAAYVLASFAAVAIAFL
jgi:hypothetical protein